MNVKGFILEDDQGREFVMVCEKPYLQPGGPSRFEVGNGGAWFRYTIQNESFAESLEEC